MQTKAKLLFVSSRPISWVNTAFPFAAGYLYFTHTVDIQLIIGTLFFLIPYNLLMYGINDVYDYESDMKNPRKGGVEGGVVAKKYHRFLLGWSYLLPVPFVAVLLWLGSFTSALVLLGCLLFVIAYSVKGLRFKEIPLLDSLTSSLHFVGPLLYALSLIGWPTAAWPVVIAFTLWGMASQSLGAVQDVPSDRAAGIRSIATVFGARFTIWYALVFYIAASVVLAATASTAAIVIALAGLVYALNILPYLRIADDTSPATRAAWKRFLWLNYIVGAIVTISLIFTNTL